MGIDVQRKKICKVGLDMRTSELEQEQECKWPKKKKCRVGRPIYGEVWTR